MSEIFPIQIIGDGPASTALFVAADKLRCLPEFSRDILHIGTNAPNRYGMGYFFPNLAIRSNSPAGDFLENFPGLIHFGDLLTSQTAETLSHTYNEIVDLRLVAQWQQEIGSRTRQLIEDGAGIVLSDTKVSSLECTEGAEGVLWESYDPFGGIIARSRQVILATGAREVKDDHGENANKVFLSTDILKAGGVAAFSQQFPGPNKSVTIIGGSHGALSAAWRLLHPEEFEGEALIPPSQLTVLHRSPIKTFYDPNRDISNYRPKEIPSYDQCSQTKRVNRFGGIRGDARDTFLFEPKIRYVSGNNPDLARETLDSSDAIIQATGLQTNFPSLYFRSGQTRRQIQILLRDHQAVVGSHSEILDESGKPLPNIFGIGLGFGVTPSPEIGGETSLIKRGGRIASVNLYQGLVGERILQKILALK